MEIFLAILQLILWVVLVPIGFLLALAFVFCVIIPIALCILPSSWVFSREHTAKLGRVRGIGNKLYHHFVNYSHPNRPEFCGCKTCNYAGRYEGLSLEQILNGETNPIQATDEELEAALKGIKPAQTQP